MDRCYKFSLKELFNTILKPTVYSLGENIQQLLVAECFFFVCVCVLYYTRALTVSCVLLGVF